MNRLGHQEFRFKVLHRSWGSVLVGHGHFRIATVFLLPSGLIAVPEHGFARNLVILLPS